MYANAALVLSVGGRRTQWASDQVSGRATREVSASTGCGESRPMRLTLAGVSGCENPGDEAETEAPATDCTTHTWRRRESNPIAAENLTWWRRAISDASDCRIVGYRRLLIPLESPRVPWSPSQSWRCFGGGRAGSRGRYVRPRSTSQTAPHRHFNSGLCAGSLTVATLPPHEMPTRSGKGKSRGIP